MKAHTPGPWIVRKHNDGHQIWHEPGDGLRSLIVPIINDFDICEEHGGDSLSNAALIASAPDLLAALVDAEFLMRQAGKIPGPMQDSFNRSAEDARAAIARARGQ